MILFDHLSLLSLCFPFSFWLSLCALSAPHAPPLLCCCPVSGEDLERNDGSSSRPYYMSPGLHKILRKVEEDAKLGTTSWAMCGRFTELVTLSLTSPYLLYVCGGSGHLRASTVGLNIKTGCIPAWSGTTWKWKDMLSFQFLTEKAWGGLEKDLCLLPLLSQLRYLPFFLPCLCSIFFSSLYSLLTSALPRGYVSTRQTDTQAEMNMSIFIQTNMRTLKCTDATDGLWHKASR